MHLTFLWSQLATIQYPGLLLCAGGGAYGTLQELFIWYIFIFIQYIGIYLNSTYKSVSHFTSSTMLFYISAHPNLKYYFS